MYALLNEDFPHNEEDSTAVDTFGHSGHVLIPIFDIYILVYQGHFMFISSSLLHV